MNNTVYQNNTQAGAYVIPETNNTNYSATPEVNVNRQDLDCNYVEKYRIRDFNSMIGNEDAIKTLLAETKYNSYLPAKILFGPPSSGKSSAAMIQAKLVNCQSPKELGVPCEECESCRSIAVKSNPDVIIINAGNHNGVDTSREIEEQLQTPPLYNMKVVILEEWQKMTPNALTSLLTVIENPSVSAKTAAKPKYMFIMPTTELPTVIADKAILSRAITVKFYPIPKDKLIARLREICSLEGISFEEGVLECLYEHANGAMRDCLQHLQVLATRSDFNITLDSIKRFFGAENSSLSKDLFAAIHSLNPVNVSTVINNHCKDVALRECDFNDLANLFVQASTNSTPFMHDIYTKCLRVVIDNRIVFLKDPSRKAQENLIIACQEIVTILRDNLGVAISNYIKDIDLDLGNLLLSLNPNIRMNNGQIIFTLNPPTLGLGYLSSKFQEPQIISALNSFYVSRLEFNNVGRDICYKVAAVLDRNLGEVLFNLNPTTQVENGQLVLYLNQLPTTNPEVFEKLDSPQMKEILNSFGVSQYLINGVQNTSVCTNTATNNVVQTNAYDPNLALNVCNNISAQYDPNFGNFLCGLNPTIMVNEQNQLVLCIDRPNMDISYFESYMLCDIVQNILRSNGIVNHQYR